MRSLPPAARVWWAVVVVGGILAAPVVAGAGGERVVPLELILLAAAGAALYALTWWRKDGAAASFDFSGLCIVSALLLAGPLAAMAAAAGRHVVMCVLRRPVWFKPAYSVGALPLGVAAAWGVSHWLAPTPFAALAGAVTWSAMSALLSGVMAGLASREGALAGVRNVVRGNGWADLQEVVLSVCLVTLWRQHPLLALTVPLAAYGQSRMMHGAIRARVRALQAEAAARLDGLTQVANRRTLDAALSRRSAGAGAVLMVDLDHFKRVNDEHGHGAGDAVLRAAARAIEAAVRPTDLVARYGGEEFCVLLWSVASGEEVVEIAERIRLSVAGARPGDFPALGVTASIGAAVWRPDQTPAAAIGEADRVLYRAKQAGRDNVQVADLPGYAERIDALASVSSSDSTCRTAAPRSRATPASHSCA